MGDMSDVKQVLLQESNQFNLMIFERDIQSSEEDNEKISLVTLKYITLC